MIYAEPLLYFPLANLLLLPGFTMGTWVKVH
jgi:hypothetical protein